MRLNLFLSYKPSQALPRWRRWLGRLGPSWSAVPLRRAIQALCLLLFVLLLVHAGGEFQQSSPGPAARPLLPSQSFLWLDPLVSISAAIAGRLWLPSLLLAAAVLAVGLVLPRAFCGYVCPLGTWIDFWDWAVFRRSRRLNVGRPWWVHLRFFILAGLLAAAAAGMMLAGFLSAIPLLTRGLVALLALAGLARPSLTLPELTISHFLVMAALVLLPGLSLLGRRFWCRHLCPSGALLSLTGAVGLIRRRVGASCTACGKCRLHCPPEAIGADFAARAAECVSCQTCGGICPVGAIHFGTGDQSGAAPACLPAGRAETAQPAEAYRLSRRALLSGGVGGAAAFVGAGELLGWHGVAWSKEAQVRPPGAIAERQFLQTCVRCGQCVRACPSGTLEPMGLGQALAGLWSPRLNCDRSGCLIDCRACGQVCPTRAIKPLDLQAKQAVRLGLAVVDVQRCLPHAGKGQCTACFEACERSGHNAIEMVQVTGMLGGGDAGGELGIFAAPDVQADKCVGCGQCQSRCYQFNVSQRRLLSVAAIRVQAGEGMADRL